MQLASGKEMEGIAGVAFLGCAGMQKAGLDLEYFRAQKSLWHTLKVIW